LIDIELTPAQLEGSAAFSTDDSRPGELVMTWRSGRPGAGEHDLFR
jgi:hypothetical protein